MNKKLKTLLIIGLVLVILGSLFAQAFNTSLYKVNVSRISFEAANGTLSGLLYMPKDASADNPKPTIIVTHGYLNSAEMQDANAIELSRRGFVVLALDQYDHGHSDLNDEVYSDSSFFGVWLPFWANSQYDAVSYMYQQPYVLKDAEGNGVIGITGHSMGGFSSTVAVAKDELQYAESGYRMIAACLTEGSDFSYSSFIGFDAATCDALSGGRYMGKVAAHYDEFFFNNSEEEGTVRYKDYVSAPDGMTFLQSEGFADANTWYSTSDGGQRIIYEPAQTHPWNHFSAETTGYAVSFYTTAFAGYEGIDTTTTSQIWQLKEAFELVALVGFVMLIIAFASLMIKLPFFKNAVSGEIAVAPSPKGGMLAATWAILIFACSLSLIFFVPLMDGGAGSPGVNVLFYAGIVVAVAGIAACVINAKKSKNALTGAVCMIVSGAALALIAKLNMYSDNAVWTALGVNSIAYWTIGCALMSACVLSTVYTFLKAKDGIGAEAYGISLKPMVIIAGICAGLATVVAGYIVLFIVDAIFKTDFRIWTFAFKTFDANIIPAILRYLPTFLLFYIVSTISITINTNTEGLRGWKGYVVAILLNAGGPFLWLVIQYGKLFASGAAAWPTCALSGIELVAMVPTLAVAAIISRNLYKKTGNIWMPAVINGVLMTTMAIANTMVVFK